MLTAGLTLLVVGLAWKLYNVIFVGKDPSGNYLTQDTVNRIMRSRNWVDEHLEVVE